MGVEAENEVGFMDVMSSHRNFLATIQGSLRNRLDLVSAADEIVGIGWHSLSWVWHSLSWVGAARGQGILFCDRCPVPQSITQSKSGLIRSHARQLRPTAHYSRLYAHCSS